MAYPFTCVLHILLCYNVVFVLSNNETDNSTTPSTTPRSTTAAVDIDWRYWCKFQPDSNDCSHGEHRGRFYFDIKLEDCKSFIYGDCPHTHNVFNTLNECHRTCNDVGMHPLKDVNISETVRCRLQPDFGICQDYHPMFYYDINTKHCKGFSYSGCGGNSNRFLTYQLCATTCAKAIGEYAMLYKH